MPAQTYFPYSVTKFNFVQLITSQKYLLDLFYIIKINPTIHTKIYFISYRLKY